MDAEFSLLSSLINYIGATLNFLHQSTNLVCYLQTTLLSKWFITFVVILYSKKKDQRINLLFKISDIIYSEKIDSEINLLFKTSDLMPN